MGEGGTGLDPTTLRSLGGVYARALILQVARRGETIPVEHAFAIVLAAAAKLEAAHAAGRRANAVPEAVLIRHDGTVELGVARTPLGGASDDVATLGRLLVELLGNADLPGELAATIAGLIAPDRHGSVKELARSLAQIAQRESLSLSKGAVGRWVRSVMVPHYRPTPPVGVGTGSNRSLANGSGTFGGDERFAEIPTGVKEIIETTPPPVRSTLLAADPPAMPDDDEAEPSPSRSRVRPLGLLLVLVAVAAAAYTFRPHIQRLAAGASAPASVPAAIPAARPAVPAVAAEASIPVAAAPPEDPFDAISAADAAAEPAAIAPATVAPTAPTKADDTSKRRHGKKRGAKRRGR